MYIEQAYKGKNDVWRYIIGLVTIFIGWQFVGMIPLAIFLFPKMMEEGKAVSEVSEMSNLLGSNLFLFLMLLSFTFGLVATFFTCRSIHLRSITTLTTSRKKIDWKRIFFAFAFWAIITISLTGVDILSSPEDYVYNFELTPFLILLAISVLFIPLQTSFEEYFMRGYLMQMIGLAAKNRWVPLLITSVFFGLLHVFNPEVEKLGYGIMVYYVGTGLFLGILTLMDDGLELAIGFHAANNLITALLVTADWTAFQTHSLYRDVSDPELGWDVFVPVLIVYPLLLFIFSKKYKWTNWKEKLTGNIVSKETLLGEDEVNQIGV